MTSEPSQAAAAPPNPWREITQPFVDLLHASRALWGVNLGNLIEGMVYFGILSYLAMYFNEYVGLNDVWAGRMVGALTAGITISMFFFGGMADRWGVRVAIIAAFGLLLVGRVLLSLGPTLNLPGGQLGSPMHLLALAGILVIVLGYGMYQPACYAAIRQFTTPQTAGMGYAMLYAIMNLGGWLPSFFGPIRRSVGIGGAMWVYTALTATALVATLILLSRRTCERAITEARAANPTPPAPTAAADEHAQAADPAERGFSISRWLREHPLANAKFSFFIFCLIPVQTLFAHNWLTLPQYVERAFRGSWIGDYFEFAVNLNPLLIFVLTPIAAAFTQKAKVYNLMIIGTFIMGAPTFLLALGPNPLNLFSFLFFMSLGEAIWSPRFLQYAAEIAPDGRTGAYMGVAQFPWFLTKLIVPLYSGWFLQHYCPDSGPLRTETMWLIYGGIAMLSTVLLVLALGWVGRDFKTKAT